MAGEGVYEEFGGYFIFILLLLLLWPPLLLSPLAGLWIVHCLLFSLPCSSLCSPDIDTVFDLQPLESSCCQAKSALSMV